MSALRLWECASCLAQLQRCSDQCRCANDDTDRYLVTPFGLIPAISNKSSYEDSDGQSSLEAWRSIPGLPGYQVSNFGRVRRLKPRAIGAGLFVPQCLRGGKRSYFCVSITLNGQRHNYGVHVLVLLAFISPRPTPRHHAAHCDGNPFHNSVANLKWKSPKENAADRVLHGTQLIGSRVPVSKLDEAQVSLILQLLLAGFKTQSIADKFGVYLTNVTRILRRQAWRHVECDEAAIEAEKIARRSHIYRTGLKELTGDHLRTMQLSAGLLESERASA